MVSLIIIILSSCDTNSVFKVLIVSPELSFGMLAETHRECIIYDPTSQFLYKPLQGLYSLKSYEV